MLPNVAGWSGLLRFRQTCLPFPVGVGEPGRVLPSEASFPLPILITYYVFLLSYIFLSRILRSSQFLSSSPSNCVFGITSIEVLGVDNVQRY